MLAINEEQPALIWSDGTDPVPVRDLMLDAETSTTILFRHVTPDDLMADPGWWLNGFLPLPDLGRFIEAWDTQRRT